MDTTVLTELMFIAAMFNDPRDVHPNRSRVIGSMKRCQNLPWEPAAEDIVLFSRARFFCLPRHPRGRWGHRRVSEWSRHMHKNCGQDYTTACWGKLSQARRFCSQFHNPDLIQPLKYWSWDPVCRTGFFCLSMMRMLMNSFLICQVAK